MKSEDTQRWTQKACEGCGVKARREQGKVCHRCRSLMADGERARAESVGEDDKVFIGHERHYSELRAVIHSGGREGMNLDREFSGAWHDLLLAVTKEAYGTNHIWSGDCESLISPKTEGFGRNDGNDWRTACIIPIKAREALNAVDSCIRRMIELSHKSGLADGSNLLLRLAQGHVTTEAFDDAREAALYSRQGDKIAPQ